MLPGGRQAPVPTNTGPNCGIVRQQPTHCSALLTSALGCTASEVSRKWCLPAALVPRRCHDLPFGGALHFCMLPYTMIGSTRHKVQKCTCFSTFVGFLGG